MKSVFLIYTTDAHHSYASYSLSGVFHTKEGAIDALHPQLRKSAFAEYRKRVLAFCFILRQVGKIRRAAGSKGRALRRYRNLLQETITMKHKQLPQRAFNSPVIQYANFEDGSFVNLIRLNKPYANGDAYAVYQTSKSPLCRSGLFKSLHAAKENFGFMVRTAQEVSNLREHGITGN